MRSAVAWNKAMQISLRLYDVVRDSFALVLQCAYKATVILGFTYVVLSSSAFALPTCEGTFAATSLQPLPTRPVVNLDIYDQSPENKRLAERFLAGVRGAGVAVDVQSNVQLHATISILGEKPDRFRAAEQTYPGMMALQGGIYPSLPAMPSSRLTTPRPSAAQRVLVLRIDASEGQAARISWIASIQCRRTGLDDGQLAQDLGQVIGAALGQRIERRPL